MSRKVVAVAVVPAAQEAVNKTTTTLPLQARMRKRFARILLLNLRWMRHLSRSRQWGLADLRMLLTARQE